MSTITYVTAEIDAPPVAGAHRATRPYRVALVTDWGTYVGTYETRDGALAVLGLVSDYGLGVPVEVGGIVHRTEHSWMVVLGLAR